MNYVDFELKIGKAVNGRYPLSVRGPEAGDFDTDIAIEQPPELATLARSSGDVGNPRSALHTAADSEARDIHRKQAVTRAAESIEAARRVGEKLFTSLLATEAYAMFVASVGMARKDGKGVRVRLRIEPAELNALPWEFLFNPGAKQFVGLSQHTPITRYLQVLHPNKPLTIEPPLRILGMIASPSDLPRLNVEGERARITAALEQRVASGAIEIKWVEGSQWRDLQTALRPNRGPWHVFHFIGHGGFDADSGEGIIALCGDGGTTHRVTASTLGGALGDHPSLRLIVLNSCEGARGSATDSFSSTGAAILGTGIPAVVSMQYEISDAAALEFARTFYDCLAEPQPVEVAVTEGRKAINGRWSSATVEWGTPVLHLRAPNGQLFEVDRATKIFGDAGPAPRTEAMPRYSGQMAVPKRPAAHVASEALRGLDILRRKVRRSWIDGVLERDAQYSSLVELGMEAIGGLVDNRLGARSDDGQIVELSTAQTIRDVYREQAGSLLVLGEPGSGKTTAVLTIARDLLDRADQSPDAAIPVVFNLSSWATRKLALRAWMADELAEKYAVPVKVGQAWLAIDRLIPFLDGLDEVGTKARAECVDAINRFQDETNLAAMVVACRYREYAELTTRLTLNAAVRLRQLTLEQVDKVVASGGESLAALAHALGQDSGLRVEARSPLMLRIMVDAYRGVRIEDLTHESAESATARRNRIVEAYVERKLRLGARGVPES